MIKYTEEKTFTQDQVQELFKSVGWISAEYPQRLHKALMTHRLFLPHGMVGERLVGLARVLDDSELVAFVHYVLVHPEYQGQKIAGNMVEYIRDKYKNYLYIEGMQEDSKNVAFYERHGFHVMEGGTPIQICNFSDKR